MVAFFCIIAYLALFILLYIYVGYPTLLLILGLVSSGKVVRKKPIRPSVTLIISCYNEEDVIRDKLKNCFKIDYPKDRFEIIVVSDASTDRTDEIVSEYLNQGVRLIGQEKQLGKTAGLNLAVSQARGEIVVFSDANSMYDPDAIIKLVENFADEKVGYVVGEAKYIDIKSTPAAKSENTYWRYEIFLKKMESRVHSVVGGDGAIYGIRHELYEELLHTDINDFVNPLQIILKGYRGVYEPEAICREKTSGSFRKEFSRKLRIVNRSFSGLLRVKSVLNPFKTGIFSFQIISHKLLRWFAPAIMLCFGASSAALSLHNEILFQWIIILIILFLWCGYIGHLLSTHSDIYPLFYYPYYFISANVASLMGVFRSLKGEVQVTWNTCRGEDDERETGRNWVNIAINVFTGLSIWFFLLIVERLSNINLLAVKTIFWTCLATIIYVYFGYPLVLLVLSKFFSKPIQRSNITPEVTMLICAYNEGEVIEEKIKNCFAINYPREKLNIVIASDGSTDKTNEIVRKYVNNQLTLVNYPERRGKMSVINETMPKLSSEIIIFSDANTMYAKEAIMKLVRNFYDPSVGAVSADVILRNEETKLEVGESAYYCYERWIQKKESEFISVIGADGGMYAIRRNLFVAPSPNIILDDFVISMNVALRGYRLAYDNEAVGHEKNTNSFRTEFLRKSRVIAGAIQSVKQKEGVPSIRQKKLLFCYLSHKFLRWMVPVCLLAVFLANIPLALFSGMKIYSITMGLQILFYLLALCPRFFSSLNEIAITSIPFYFCLANAAAIYGIYKGIFNKQSVKWQKFSREREKR